MNLKVISEHIEPWSKTPGFKHVLVRVYAHPSGFKCKTVAPVESHESIKGRLGRLTRTASDHSAVKRFILWRQTHA